MVAHPCPSRVKVMSFPLFFSLPGLSPLLKSTRSYFNTSYRILLMFPVLANEGPLKSISSTHFIHEDTQLRRSRHMPRDEYKGCIEVMALRLREPQLDSYFSPRGQFHQHALWLGPSYCSASKHSQWLPRATARCPAQRNQHGRWEGYRIWFLSLASLLSSIFL